MSGAAVAVLLIIVGFLVLSAAAKAIHRRTAADALIELGLARRAARAGVAAAAAMEAAVATAITLWPHTVAAQVACLLLFGAFAVVAARALRLGRAIECGCLGALHRSTLGWTQIVQFTLVVPSVIIVGRFGPTWSAETGLGAFFGVQVVVGSLLLLYLSPVWWRIRGDRVSLASVQAYVREAGWPEMRTTHHEAWPR